MWCHGCHVGVAKETKCAKVSVARSMAEQCLVRCEEGQTFADGDKWRCAKFPPNNVVAGVPEREGHV
jgi:hypothetical protein